MSSTSLTLAGQGGDAALDDLARRLGSVQRVVLVNLPQVPLRDLDRAVARAGGYFNYPPHALLYLSAVLDDLEMEHAIIDLNLEVLEAAVQGRDIDEAWRAPLRAAVAAPEPVAFGVTFMFEATRPNYDDVTRAIRDLAPGAPLIVGGVNASAHASQLLEGRSADAVVRHEGERGWEALWRWAAAGGGPPPPNLVWRGTDGAARSADAISGGAVDADLTAAFNRLPMQRYAGTGSLSNFARMRGPDSRSFSVLAKRGCRARCAFCGVRSFNGKGIRLRENGRVVDEMEHLHRRYGIDHFEWLDDDLLYDSGATIDLLDTLAERLPEVTWSANNGLIASSINRPIYEAMRRSRCVGFKVGLESGNPEVLKRVHKPTGLKQFFRFSELMADFPEIFVATNYILGLPLDTYEQMLDSLRVALRSRCHWNSFYLYQPIRGTEFFSAFGGLGDDPDDRPLHGRENEGPRFKDRELRQFNPARDSDAARHTAQLGYEAVTLDGDLVPEPGLLREVWFAFNALANFIRNPALETTSEALIDNTIRWLEALISAYPRDASMKALLARLISRKEGPSATRREALRLEAQRLLSEDPYWQARDRAFAFSAFLEDDDPPVPAAVDERLATPAPAADELDDVDSGA